MEGFGSEEEDMDISIDQLRKKRKRAPNFTAEEKCSLISIISNKYSAIIEDKKTDRTSLHQRLQAWKKIETDFNSQSPSLYYREWSVLKKFYENRKKEARKLKAIDRAEQFKTDSGPEVKTKRNTKDSNRLIENNIIKTEESTSQDGEYILNTGDDIEDNCDEEWYDNPEIDVARENTWKKYTPGDLSNPMAPTLKVVNPPQRKEVVTPSKNTPYKINCRRPLTVRTLTSSDVASKYNLLLDKRLVLVRKQLEQIENETAFKKEENKLKLELLNLKIQIKKQCLETVNK